FDDQLPGEVAALAGRTPDRILSRIQEAAVEFCQGKLRDDITMLALRGVEAPGAPGPQEAGGRPARPGAASSPSASKRSRRYRSARASSGETCIWEMPSRSPISAWVMLP